MIKENFFITGTDTDVGKTVFSAILVEALNADYWKPIQCGSLADSDTKKVEELVSNSKSHFHQEGLRLKAPRSPHFAAKLEAKSIELKDFSLPDSLRSIVVEGAGGVLVPINDKNYVIDLAKSLNLKTILVTKSYLGSYNHTLCAIEALESRGLPLWGIVFNGDSEEGFEDFICQKAKTNRKFNLRLENKIHPNIIANYSKEFRSRFLNDSH